MKRYNKPMTLSEMKAIKDTDIDFTDIPEADENFWTSAQVTLPDNKTKMPLNMRLDADVVEWFRSHGKGYQTRMNAVLRSFYEAHKTTPQAKR